MKTRFYVIKLAAILALIALGGAARAHAQKYTLVAIPNPPGLSGTCNPYAVNDRGQAVGSFVGFNGLDLPFLYDPLAGTRILPGFTTVPGSKALSINHAGLVVGIVEGSTNNFGFVWDSVNGTRRIDQIGDANGVTAASLGWNIDSAWKINTQGDILVSDFSTGIRIGIWRMTTAGGVSTLNILPVPYDGLNTGILGFSTDLNDNGIVLTYQPTTLTDRQPALWDSNSGAFTDISPAFGLGVGLNNNGDAVGGVGDGYYSGTAWLYSGSATLTNLGSLGGGAFPSGINDLNQIVGSSRVSLVGSAKAFLWQNGVMQDLNIVINPGRKWVLSSANAISNPANTKHTAGYIAGTGTYTGLNVGWIATPK